MSITKLARIVKRKKKGKTTYCVIGHRKTKGKYRNFGCYSSEAAAKKRLGQIYAFKGRKASILYSITSISEALETKGMVHIADAINNCAEYFISDNSKEDCVIGLGKVASLLESKGEAELSERIDALVPEVLEFEDFGEEVRRPKTRKMVSADRIYLMASKLYDKYIVGLIDDRDFEYEKMKELISMLRAGFLLPPPKDYKILPKDADNWWEHFCKRGK